MNVRAVLEVLKFCDARCLLHSADYTSKLWTHCCACNELWDSLLDTHHFPPRDTHPAKLWFRLCNSLTLPVIRKNQCTVYSLPGLKTRAVPFFHEISVDSKSMWCWMGRKSMLCCGGGLGLVAYKVLIDTGDVRPMARMKQERCSAGIIKFKGFVYLIGGSTPIGKSHWYTGEKYDFVRNQWSLLRGTLDTWSICPSLSLFSGKIYVVAAWTNKVNVFDPDSERFSIVPVELPIICGSLTSVVTDHYLVIMGNDQILKYDLKTWSLIGQNRASFDYLWANSPPVKWTKYAFCVVSYGMEGIVRMDLETLTAEVVLRL